MNDAELIELFTYIAKLKDRIKYLENQNSRLAKILKKEGILK